MDIYYEEKHLAGRHDQKRHGRPGEGSSAQEGLPPDDDRLKLPSASDAGLTDSDLYDFDDQKQPDIDDAALTRFRDGYDVVGSSLLGLPQDMNFGAEIDVEYMGGRQKVSLPGEGTDTLSSFTALPMIALGRNGVIEFVGAPGSGKTTAASLIGMLVGASEDQVREGIVHGTADLTEDQLLGLALPRDILQARRLQDIKVEWAPWLRNKVRVIDEYNRMNPKVQAALLTLLADKYAHFRGQTLRVDDGVWYVTANDAAGGGTYPVVEALKDRIDASIPSSRFSSQHLRDLEEDIALGRTPSAKVLTQGVVLTPETLARVRRDMNSIRVEPTSLRKLAYFFSNFDYLPGASPDVTRAQKDVARLYAEPSKVGRLLQEETGLDKLKDLGFQTLGGLSTRAFQTTLAYAKGLAYLRGERVATDDDIRNAVGFTLAGRLIPDPNAAFFQEPANKPYLTDRPTWIKSIYDEASRGYDPVWASKVEAVSFPKEIGYLTEGYARSKLAETKSLLEEIAQGKKVYGPLQDDIRFLRDQYAKYNNYLTWLKKRRKRG